MSRSSLAVVAGLVVVTALVARSPAAGAQSGSPLEYIRMTPYVVQVTAAPNAVLEGTGYRACLAKLNGWTCREFLPTDPGARARGFSFSTDALRIALVTLGNEGWELVSAVDEDPGVNSRGLTYLFKRQAR
jgi:hypothetical protein